MIFTGKHLVTCSHVKLGTNYWTLHRNRSSSIDFYDFYGILKGGRVHARPRKEAYQWRYGSKSIQGGLPTKYKWSYSYSPEINGRGHGQLGLFHPTSRVISLVITGKGPRFLSFQQTFLLEGYSSIPSLKVTWHELRKKTILLSIILVGL